MVEGGSSVEWRVGAGVGSKWWEGKTRRAIIIGKTSI